ncbi:MAG TPA: branched-chain amino acid ABC transporter permease [Xanthobacteraceae bacterium]|nr:branched-chain amino acid ABC transporter permease [Xanthobacteraceae bacterium]
MSLPRIAGYALAAVVLLALPFAGSHYEHFLLNTALIYTLIALSLVILIGYAGQISIGHAGFWALGAFASAILVTKTGAPFLVGVLFGGIVAAVFGALVAIPALRVQGHYLAIATLGFALIVQQTLFEWESLTGGRQGMFVPRPSLAGHEFTDDFGYYYIILAIVVPFFLLTVRLPKTRFGRRLIALKLSPLAAASFGVNRARYLTAAFTLSAFLTGISGALYAHMIGHLATETFSLITSLSFLTMAVIGGILSPVGAVLGGIYLTVAPEFLREFKSLQMVIYGVLLVLFMRFLPHGLASLPKRVWTGIQRRRALKTSSALPEGRSHD